MGDVNSSDLMSDISAWGSLRLSNRKLHLSQEAFLFIYLFLNG